MPDDLPAAHRPDMEEDPKGTEVDAALLCLAVLSDNNDDATTAQILVLLGLRAISVEHLV